MSILKIKPQIFITNIHLNKKAYSELYSKKNQITFYVNVRINNYIKNKAEALSAIVLYKSQKEAIDGVLDYLINSFTELKCHVLNVHNLFLFCLKRI